MYPLVGGVESEGSGMRCFKAGYEVVLQWKFATEMILAEVLAKADCSHSEIFLLTLYSKEWPISCAYYMLITGHHHFHDSVSKISKDLLVLKKNPTLD